MKVILASVLVLIAGLVTFHKFMTYDRKYNWSKELEEEVKIVAQLNGFRVSETRRIGVDSIKLPGEREIKIHIQKALSKIDLMNYGREFGVHISLESDDSKEFLNCKAWCLSDHVIGLEIEYDNITGTALTKLKQHFETHFDNYKIVWTRQWGRPPSCR